MTNRVKNNKGDSLLSKRLTPSTQFSTPKPLSSLKILKEDDWSKLSTDVTRTDKDDTPLDSKEVNQRKLLLTGLQRKIDQILENTVTAFF